MQHVQELLNLIGGQLEETANSDLVAGEPLTLGKHTVVPLSRFSLGMGGGGGEGEGMPHHHHGPKFKGKQCAGPGKGTGGGTGGGAQIRPVAVAVFTDEGVKILSIPNRKGTLDKLFDKIPDLIDRFQPKDR